MTEKNSSNPVWLAGTDETKSLFCVEIVKYLAGSFFQAPLQLCEILG